MKNGSNIIYNDQTNDTKYSNNSEIYNENIEILDSYCLLDQLSTVKLQAVKKYPIVQSTLWKC